MADIRTLLLFVHLTMPRKAGAAREYTEKWRGLIADRGPKQDSAICVLPSSPDWQKDVGDLYSFAQEQFGDRCVLAPTDASDRTKGLLAEDLLRTLAERGRFEEWRPYELWTSVMARRWTEGLKRELAERGHAYDPATLHVVSCGQQWAGCLTKYSMLMPKYLGVERTPDVRPDLSPGAGWPFQARFIERIQMERHVSLFLFEAADGRPMGQFTDGLRPIWESPHVALVAVDPEEVELHSVTPNEGVQVDPSRGHAPDGIVADVGDGCQPRFTTVLGQRGAHDALRRVLASARIESRAVWQRGTQWSSPLTAKHGSTPIL